MSHPIRLSVLVIAVLGVACACSSNHPARGTAAYGQGPLPTATPPASSTHPMGWQPVTAGNAEVFVPPTWRHLDLTKCPGSGASTLAGPTSLWVGPPTFGCEALTNNRSDFVSLETTKGYTGYCCRTPTVNGMPGTASDVAPSPPANYGNLYAIFYRKPIHAYVIISIAYHSGDEKLAHQIRDSLTTGSTTSG